mgnify:CR=1 FL=1
MKRLVTPVLIAGVGFIAATGVAGALGVWSDFGSVAGQTIGAASWDDSPGVPMECGAMEFDEVWVGTEGPDVLDLRPPEQGAKRNLVFGLAGDDVIHGGNQDDCLVGGDGIDILFGENGMDIGGNGGDALDGGNGEDLLYGDGGDDVLIGGNAKDVLSGGDGEDVCTGGNAPDTALPDCEVVNP